MVWKIAQVCKNIYLDLDISKALVPSRDEEDIIGKLADLMEKVSIDKNLIVHYAYDVVSMVDLDVAINDIVLDKVSKIIAEE